MAKPDMALARANALDASRRMDSLLGRPNRPSLAPAREPRAEFLRAIAELRASGELRGPQALVLEGVEAYFRQGGT